MDEPTCAKGRNLTPKIQRLPPRPVNIYLPLYRIRLAYVNIDHFRVYPATANTPSPRHQRRLALEPGCFIMASPNINPSFKRAHNMMSRHPFPRIPITHQPNAWLVHQLILMTCFALCGVIAFGCQANQSGSGKKDDHPLPTARLTAAQLRNLTLRSADLVFDFEVVNPYPTNLRVLNLAYILTSGGGGGGTRFNEGSTILSQIIPPNQSAPISTAATTSFASLLGRLTNVRPGDVIPYDAHLVLTVDVPGRGPTALPPLQHRGHLPVPALPKVTLNEIRWTQMTFEQASATLSLTITNLNSFPVDLDQFRYALSLGQFPVVRDSLTPHKRLAPSVPVDLAIQFSASPKKLGVSAFKLLSGRGASYDLQGLMGMSTPFGRLDAPLQQSGQARFRR